jgi:hypothetical protein
MTRAEEARAVLNALPSPYEPARCHVLDLVLDTGLSVEAVERALNRLSDLGLVAVDLTERDPFHPPDCLHYHAGRIFTLSGDVIRAQRGPLRPGGWRLAVPAA